MTFFGICAIILFIAFVVLLIVAVILESRIESKSQKGDAVRKLKKTKNIVALSSLGCLALGVAFIVIDHNVSMNMREAYANEILFG